MAPEVKPEAEKPVPAASVSSDNVTIDIFPTTNIVGGKSYPQFRFTYFLGSQRKKRRFADLAAAKKEAEVVAAYISGQNADVLQLTSADREIYLHPGRSGRIGCLRLSRTLVYLYRRELELAPTLLWVAERCMCQHCRKCQARTNDFT